MVTKYLARRAMLDNAAQSFTIDWQDGHVSIYPLDGLRRACPCAGCQGGHENMGGLPEPELFLVPALMQWNDVRIEQVGHYALRFTWDDGHNAGIYTWRRLRDMCPKERGYTG